MEEAEGRGGQGGGRAGGRRRNGRYVISRLTQASNIKVSQLGPVEEC